MAANRMLNVNQHLRAGQNRPSMDNFRVRYPALPPAQNPNIRLATNTTVIGFFNTDNRQLIATVTPWLIREAVTAEEENNNVSEQQICAYYASVISLTLPGMYVYFRRALERNGAVIAEWNEDDIAERGFNAETAEEWEQNRILTVVAHSIFILYKNISQENYGQFMINRANALKAHGGLTGFLIDDQDIVFGLAAAMAIRTRLGADHDLRSALLQACIYLRVNATPPANTLFTYVTDILAWTDMSYFVFICENLLLTESPIIREVSLRGEMMRLREAFVAINNDEYPQFFRVLHPPRECSILARNRFPILIAMAHRVRPNQGDAANQFVAPKNIDPNLITRLAIMHEDHMIRRGEMEHSDNVDFLTNFGDNVIYPEDALNPNRPPVQQVPGGQPQQN